MTTIEPLPEDALGRIAAGEVVTDPASVVKELVENALDAGASRVEVAMENGGKDLVRVADDGCGMTPADAVRAFDRHATSKVRTAADVAAVDTLGFRGEALAAVADAATVELVTRADREESEAVRTWPDGSTEPAARGAGTTVTVRDLFADRPARRESLASTAREFAKVSDLVARYALVRPGVRFELAHDGDRTVATPGSGSRVDALVGVYDREVAGAATEFAAREEGVTVEGVACRPSVTRAGSDHVHVGVDGRAVRDPAVRRAVVAGYGSLLPGDRYPVAVVGVSVPPDRVDANVHPAKEEVAFADEAAVTGAVEAAVRDALATEDLTRTADLATDVESSLEPVEGRESVFEDAAVIGAFRDLYVLCEADDGLLVVDGHAAHERVNYERLRAAVGEGVPSVDLDPPATLSLSPREAALVSDPAVRAALADLGFDVAPDGGDARVSAVPAPVGRAADPGALQDVLDRLRGDGSLGGDGTGAPGSAAGPTRIDADPETLLDEDPLADLACHPSLKAGDDFDDDTARRLVDRLGSCEHPYACPHGRPTVLSIDEATLVRGFDRENTRLE
ncbi:DNA mismatch repair protein MutL [Halobacteriales archaeon QS_8_69_26]|nr:MAG: DNA mismatch repair protein MutL [Halobacteriales archaeon QS_8_69_26]